MSENWLENAAVALSDAQASGDRTDEARMADNLGRLMVEVHRDEDALQHYDRALTLNAEAGNQLAVAEIHPLIAIARTRVEQIDLAKQHLLAALAEPALATCPYTVNYALLNLGR